ncbi:YncE family protein [Actinacidiphila glaucinigra]
MKPPWGSDTLSVINTTSNAVQATVPVGQAPVGVATDPSRGRVYVTNLLSGTLSVVNSATNQVVSTIAVGSGPVGVAVDQDTRTSGHPGW